MMKSTYFSKILIMALLLNIPGSAEALSFSAMWHSVRSSISRVLNHKYTKPVAILAAVAAVGLAGYMVKRDFDRTRESHWQNYLRKGRVSFDTVHVPGRQWTIGSGDDQVKLNQVITLDQMSSQGCGGASCGYHTLKNGVAIASLTQGIDRSNWLSDHQQAQTLFAPVL